MATITVRNLEDETVERLKRQAEANRRSLEAEVRTILAQAVKPTLEECRKQLEQWQKEQFGDRVLSDSSPLLREDREA
jgi:plasmid stability protein